MSERPQECRACRCVIERGLLACPKHWKMLPGDLRRQIIDTFNNGPLLEYSQHVGAADKIWQDAGVWRPGIPGDKPTLEVLAERGEL